MTIVSGFRFLKSFAKIGQWSGAGIKTSNKDVGDTFIMYNH